MVHHATSSTLAAGTRARVDALVVEASLVAIAVRIRDTFGPAAGVRITDVLRHAGAGPHAVSLVADSVGTAGGRVAGCTGLLGGRWFWGVKVTCNLIKEVERGI